MNGYQTLDSNEWLDANYEFTDEVDGTGRFSQDKTEVVEALDYSDKVNIFTVTNQELQSKLDSAWAAFGFSESMVQNLTQAVENEARVDGQNIRKEFEEKAALEKEIAAQDEAQKEKDAEAIKKILAGEALDEVDEEEEAELEDDLEMKEENPEEEVVDEAAPDLGTEVEAEVATEVEKFLEEPEIL